MRLALGVAQAVSHCRGFEPSTHQRFWRHVVKTLWFGPQHRGIIDTLALSPMAFDHVKIFWRGRTFFDEAFWVGFFYGTPECDAALGSVLETLKPHTASGQLPPSLKVSLAYGSQGDWVAARTDGLLRSDSLDTERLVTPDALKIILRAALDPLEALAAAPTHLGLVVEYRIGDNVYLTRETLDLLAQARTLPRRHAVQLTMDRLTISLAFVVRTRELGHVLRSTLLHRSDDNQDVASVVLLGCSQSDYRHVGAALSAFAWASPPIETLRCSDMCDLLQPLDQNLRLAWLVYAIHTRSLCRAAATAQPLSLSLLSTGVMMGEHEKSRMEELLASGTPLREVVDDALRLRFGDANSDGTEDTLPFHVVYWRLGSTVRLACGTRLYYESARVTDDFVVATVGSSDKELDVVARVGDGSGGDFVGVVYPGVGLVWATVEAVTAWRQRVDSVQSEGGTSPMVSSLALSFDSTYGWASKSLVAYRVSTALALLVFATLESLALELAVVTHDDLVLLFERCPRLRTLTLDRCVVKSLEPLAHALFQSQRHRPHIASLSLLGVRDFRLRNAVVNYGRHHPLVPHSQDGNEHDDGGALALLVPLLGALASGATRGVLRELHIDLMGLKTADALAALTQIATAVASPLSTSLTRLHMACRIGLRSACVALLDPLRDVVLPDPPHVRLAVVSVLQAFGCTCHGIAREVLALAEGTVVRAVTWEHSYR